MARIDDADPGSESPDLHSTGPGGRLQPKTSACVVAPLIGAGQRRQQRSLRESLLASNVDEASDAPTLNLDTNARL